MEAASAINSNVNKTCCAAQEAEVSGRTGGAQPSWSEGFLSGGSGEAGPSATEEWVPQLARANVPDAPSAELELAERPSGMLDFLSQVSIRGNSPSPSAACSVLIFVQELVPSLCKHLCVLVLGCDQAARWQLAASWFL